MNIRKTGAAAALAYFVLAGAGALTGGAVRSSAADKESFEENILLTAFWPPTYEYMCNGEGDELWDEQYRLLSEGGIDFVQNVTGRDRKVNEDPFFAHENDKETNLKMAEFAHKYGMQVGVADNRFNNLTSLSDAEIEAIVAEYRDVEGVGGYFIYDEPFDPMPYVRVYETMKRADPEGYAHLNFLPMWSYGSPAGTLNGAEESFRLHAEQWLSAIERDGYPQDYLMYDFYPYDKQSGMNREVFFSNLDCVRKLGLEYDSKTATYLQAVQGGGRAPSASEMRYEAMVCLAYGYKQLAYFTWFTPTNRGSETFSGAIIREDGKPNPKSYPAVKQLNAEIHALGKTLVKLDAREVYLNGFESDRAVWGGQKRIPSDFFLQPQDSGGYTLSLLRDKETGRNYVMFVNNDYTNPITFSVKAEGVSKLFRIDHTSGEAEETALGNGTLTLTLAAGDGELFALEEGKNFVDPLADQTDARAALSRYAEKKAEITDATVHALASELEALLAADTPQRKLDAAEKKLTSALDALPAGGGDAGDTGNSGNSGDAEKPEEEGGCGSVVGGTAGAAAAVLLLAALPIRRKK